MSEKTKPPAPKSHSSATSRKSSQRRSSAKRAAQEDTILAAAEEIFAQHGYKGTSLEDIAEQAGISKQNMLYYFPSKLELYRRLVNEILDDWLGSLESFAQDEMDLAFAMRAYIREKIQFSRERPNASRIYAMEVISGAPYITKEIKKRVVPHTRAAAERFASNWTGGQRHKNDATHLFFLIWAATQTYADFSRQMELVLGRALTADDYDAAEDLIVTMVLRAVGLDKRSSSDAPATMVLSGRRAHKIAAK